MASPFDPWRNTYGMPGPQDPNRPGEIRASTAPRWEELFRGSDVTAINRNPLVQALQRYTNRAPSGIGEVTRVSPIDGRPVAPEPTALDNLPPTVQEGIGGLSLLANFLAPGVKLPPLAPKPQGIRAYHGSPHDFDRFDMSKIGTGEGAQAYGHGLYFAEAENVAKQYRDNLSASKMTVDGKPFEPKNYGINQLIAEQRGDPARLRQRLEAYIKEGTGNPYAHVEDAQTVLAAMDRGTFDASHPGRMYEVSINADPERFLDWDKPLSGQSEAVKKALANDAISPIRSMLGGMRGKRFSDEAVQPYFKGSDLIDDIGENRIAASNALREAGIPGIRYKDAMSRDARGGGTSNYVVFDDSLIQILRKYGLLPPAAAAGASMMEQQEPPL